MWSPKGQQVMIGTATQPAKRYAIGELNYHTGETVVLIRRRKRRREIAELLEVLLKKHPTGTVYVTLRTTPTPTMTTRSKRCADLQPLVEPDRDALAPLPP